MAYQIYKAKVNHSEYPHPFIVYFDDNEETFCISTPEIDTSRPSVCNFLYPARSERDVRSFLKKIGMNMEDVSFARHYLH